MTLKPCLLSALFVLFSYAAKAQSAPHRDDTSVTALASKLHINPNQALKVKQHLDSQKVAIQKRLSDDFKQNERLFKERGIAQLSDSLKRSQAVAIASAEKMKMQQAAFNRSVTEDRKTVSKPVVIKKPRGL